MLLAATVLQRPFFFVFVFVSALRVRPLRAVSSVTGTQFCPSYTCTRQRPQEVDVVNYSSTARDAKEWRRLAVLTSLAIVVVAAFTLIAYALPAPRLVRLVTRWCDTDDCRHHAALLMGGLNRSIDPCHDFEAYACSAWTPDARFPVLSNALDDVAIAWLTRLGELLDRGAKEIPAARKPRALFTACVASAAGQTSAEDRQRFRKFLQELRLSWPETPASNVTARSVLVDLSLHWDVSLWFHIRVTRHPFATGARRIVFLPGRKSDVRLFVGNHARVMATGSYGRYWKMVYTFLTGHQPGPDVVGAIKRSAQVQGHAVAVLREIATFRSHSATSLLRLSDKLGELEFGLWLAALREHLRPYAPLTPNDDVLVTDAHLRAVADFLDSTGNADALSHISWHFAQTYYVLLFDSTLLSDDIRDDAHADASSRLATLCAMEVDAVYSHLVAALHVRIRLSSSARADFVLRTVTRKAAALASDTSWLDPDARQFLALKLESASVRLWPPALAAGTTADSFDEAGAFEKLYASCPESEASVVSFWIKARYCLRERLMVVGRRRYDAEALLPNLTPRLADYTPQLNVVDVSIAALAAPLYYSRGTLGMLYGGLGFLYSLALTSALDEAYQYVHPNGSVSESGSWISRNATEALELKQQCVESPGHATKWVRGTDIAAVELAYAVFLEQLLKSYQSNLTAELDDEKVFFMTLCRTTCSKKGDKVTPWPMVNCNELVANFQGFSDVFNCRKPSPMITENKCRFFGSA
ncbi:neprilysin-1-like [Dermacentor andersoni]|uniref:neprilysin-1-like n=1 Tax=Dermacentor andersoni TaxID=34620 RepID=UPI003B3ACD2A